MATKKSTSTPVAFDTNCAGCGKKWRVNRAFKVALAGAKDPHRDVEGGKFACTCGTEIAAA